MIEFNQNEKDLLRQELLAEAKQESLHELKCEEDESYCIEQYEDLIMEANRTLEKVAKLVNGYGWNISAIDLVY